MKYFNLIIPCLLSLLLLSCEEDIKSKQAEALKVQHYNDSIVKIISNNWKFDVPPVSNNAQPYITGWNEWQQFKNELAQKPAGNITALRQKTNNLAQKAELLNNNIPAIFNSFQVRSRISVLNTKVRSLYTYINLDVARDKKIIELLRDITRETISIQNQFDERIRFLQVPKEAGEEEMLRALDTTRMANPDAMQPQQPAKSVPIEQLRQKPQIQQLNP